MFVSNSPRDRGRAWSTLPLFSGLVALLFVLFSASAAQASEAELKLPDLRTVRFMGIDGHTLLLGGMGVCALGFVIGLAIYTQLRDLPVHKSMLEISELIYETCKTYLVTQLKFILLLEVLIGAIMAVSFAPKCQFLEVIQKLG